MEMKAMKTLLASIAVVAAVASPALAQTQDRFSDPYGAYAAPRANQYGRTHVTVNAQRRHSPNPAWDVYDDSGQYIGSDPDPLIRDSMLRESRGDN